MKPKIRLVSIMTEDVVNMVKFYKNVHGFTSKDEEGDYVELDHDGNIHEIYAD